MRRYLTKLAVIVGRYNHPTRPTIKSWVDAIMSWIDYADIYVNSTELKGTSIFNLSEPSGKIKILISFVVNCVKLPFKSLNWFYSRNSLPLKEKISTWGRHAPVIKNKPRVIHLLNSYLYGRYAKIIEELKSIAIVTFWGGDILFRPIVNKEWRENLKHLFNKCDYLHFVSNYLRNKAIDLGALQDKTFVIYPGIDVQFYQSNVNTKSKSETELIITTVGRLAWEKGIPCGIRAVKSLKNKGFNIRYWIVGDGSEKEQLLFWINELNLEENVKLLGYRSPLEIKLILSKSDIYIQPSIYDACPLSVMEASSMELPVIASNVGGIPEIVDNDITGILVPVYDVQKIEEAITFLVENKDKRIEMGKNGRKKALREFTIDRMISNWQKVYDDILTSSC